MSQSPRRNGDDHLTQLIQAVKMISVQPTPKPPPTNKDGFLTEVQHALVPYDEKVVKGELKARDNAMKVVVSPRRYAKAYKVKDFKPLALSSSHMKKVATTMSRPTRKVPGSSNTALVEQITAGGVSSDAGIASASPRSTDSGRSGGYWFGQSQGKDIPGPGSYDPVEAFQPSPRGPRMVKDIYKSRLPRIAADAEPGPGTYNPPVPAPTGITIAGRLASRCCDENANRMVPPPALYTVKDPRLLGDSGPHFSMGKKTKVEDASVKDAAFYPGPGVYPIPSSLKPPPIGKGWCASKAPRVLVYPGPGSYDVVGSMEQAARRAAGKPMHNY